MGNKQDFEDKEAKEAEEKKEAEVVTEKADVKATKTATPAKYNIGTGT